MPSILGLRSFTGVSASVSELLGGERAAYGEEIVSTLSRQLSWSHFLEIIYQKDPLKRDFYTEMCRIERWSVRTLRERMGSMLFERTAIARQKRIQIDNDDFYIDLLLYNRKLNRLAVIDLKLDDFRAEHKGQMELTTVLWGASSLCLTAYTAPTASSPLIWLAKRSSMRKTLICSGMR